MLENRSSPFASSIPAKSQEYRVACETPFLSTGLSGSLSAAGFVDGLSGGGDFSRPFVELPGFVAAGAVVDSFVAADGTPVKRSIDAVFPVLRPEWVGSKMLMRCLFRHFDEQSIQLRSAATHGHALSPLPARQLENLEHLQHRFLLALIVFRGGASASISAVAVFVFLFSFPELNLKTSWEFFPVFNFLAFCRRPPAESSPDAAISVRPRPGSRPAKGAVGEVLVSTLEAKADCRFRHHLQSSKTSPVLVHAFRLLLVTRTYAPEYSSSYRYVDYQSHGERDKRLKLRKTPIRAQSEVRTPGGAR